MSIQGQRGLAREILGLVDHDGAPIRAVARRLQELHPELSPTWSHAYVADCLRDFARLGLITVSGGPGERLYAKPQCSLKLVPQLSL